jgi:hypothetical protein
MKGTSAKLFPIGVAVGKGDETFNFNLAREGE